MGLTEIELLKGRLRDCCADLIKSGTITEYEIKDTNGTFYIKFEFSDETKYILNVKAL